MRSGFFEFFFYFSANPVSYELFRPRPAVSRSAVFCGRHGDSRLVERGGIGASACGANTPKKSFVAAVRPTRGLYRRGGAQHLRDDQRFHETAHLCRSALELAAACGALGDDSGFRPSFLGHLLVEVLLDAALAVRGPRRLEAYYRALESIDVDLVQETVCVMAPRPTERLAAMIVAFCRERILWDYLADDRLLLRLNQVMRRVGFSPLPDEFAAMFPGRDS